MGSDWLRGLLKLRRPDLRWIIVVLIGHCALAKHLFNMGLCQSPSCGLEPETALHFLVSCPRFETRRMEVWCMVGAQPQDIVEARVGDLLKFIRMTGRFNPGPGLVT